ncbi:glucuronate isomerase [Nocardiopsis tropica]|uniref:Uronate isomerase n=1 Tax=Nocardiopsis tropica TaxID=109330 RepID=A0ABU7KKM6_9ACTN|nr:glucuronate isomerase [Nocardiopsis umidischolae]MEE2049848.1 glucuronate isomerase [Nocardiopsis umidischolae]
MLYDRVAQAPIISPHGHVPVRWLATDEPFRDPVELLVSQDHYVIRQLHAGGVDLARLRESARTDPRQLWREFADRWHLFAGTATGYWLEEEISQVLGLDEPLTSATADRVYDAIAARLATPEFRPKALFRRFGIEFLATTDDPLDDLESHAALRAADLGGRVVPTFRPDSYLDPDATDFRERVDKLVAATGQPTTFAGYLAALAERRRHFIDHGAVSADHGVEEPHTADLDPVDAQHLFERVLGGTANAAQRREFRGHMLVQMARMSVEDGLVMTLHAGVLRNHSTATLARFGPDTGHDIPVRTDFVRGLRPLLERYGLAEGFHLVLFAVDETTWSRELAPLAGFYPSVFIGAPWWFLDAPDAIARFRSAVTETAGFYRGSGFVDDTRAFLSIPARHDMARRADAAFVSRLVAEGRITMPTAERVIDDLVGDLPRRVFKL